MGKYIKLFETHSEYNTYISGQDAILPNVSYCEDDNDVHYNPETRVIAKFNVTDTSSGTKILGSTTNISKIEIDGVLQPSVVDSYTFDTTGEHTIKYTLTDPTSTKRSLFYGCTDLLNVIIPNTIIEISEQALCNCENLINIIIPNSVTTIKSQAFEACVNLTSIILPKNVTNIQDSLRNCIKLESITSLAMTAPTILNNTFRYIKTGGTLYVPTGSTGYDTWMGTGNYYLGKYSWTKVEQ